MSVGIDDSKVMIPPVWGWVKFGSPEKHNILAAAKVVIDEKRFLSGQARHQYDNVLTLISGTGSSPRFPWSSGPRCRYKLLFWREYCS